MSIENVKQTAHELIEKRSKATQGEWERKIPYGGTQIAVRAKDDFDWIIGHMQVSNCPNYSEDADFIALSANHAASLAENLLVALEALELISRTTDEYLWMVRADAKIALNKIGGAE